MIRFILSKLLYLVPTFLGITIIAFSFVRILPGDPAGGQQDVLIAKRIGLPHNVAAVLVTAADRAIRHTEELSIGNRLPGRIVEIIDIDLPLGLVSFKGYEPPFVHYEARDGSGYQVLLISRQGDAKTLVALVDRLQALAVMPMGAEKSLKKSSFTLSAANDQSAAYAQADLSGGLIKGFVLIWPKTEEERAGRVLDWRIVRGSGHDALDQEVAAMIRRAEPLPPMPPEMPQPRIELTVPVQFRLS
mgnify:CR=1 FL=1